MPGWKVNRIYHQGNTVGGNVDCESAPLAQWFSINDKDRWFVSLLAYPATWGRAEMSAAIGMIKANLAAQASL